MIYVIIGLSILFFAMAFLLTENNAKYLLSGYNTMKEEERKNVDLKSFIPYYRKFHIFLAISFLLLGLGINLINKNMAGIFLGVYPILAYIFFMISSSKFSGGLKTKSNKIGVIVLSASLIFVISLLTYGYRENKIIVDYEKIEFTGMYGETLNGDEIKRIEIENDLPNIKQKTNGFALGNLRKGFFKTEDGEIIKLILNSDQKPFILFTMLNGEKIYYSAKEKSNESILEDIGKVFRIKG